MEVVLRLPVRVRVVHDPITTLVMVVSPICTEGFVPLRTKKFCPSTWISCVEPAPAKVPVVLKAQMLEEVWTGPGKTARRFAAVTVQSDWPGRSTVMEG